MRSLVEGLETPHPLGLALPGVFQEDPLIQRFLTAFDDALAPIFNTLDNLDAYFDPQLTPVDFLPWLASWVGATLDDNWPEERQRELTARAASLYRWRGTIKGLAAEVALFTGSEPEIIESGACIWSSLPGTRTPGSGEAHVRIRVRVPDPARINQTKLHAMIGAAVPADVVYDLEVLSDDQPPPTTQPVPEAEAVPPQEEEAAPPEATAEAVTEVHTEEREPEPEPPAEPQADAQPEPQAEPQQQPGAGAAAPDTDAEGGEAP